MKKFCPNCGNPVKETDNVCGNCGYKLKKKETNNSTVNRSVANENIDHSDKNTLSNTRASYMEKNHNPKHNKTIMWICGGVLAAVIIGGGIFAGRQYVNNKNAEVKTTQNNKTTTKKTTPATNKNQESNHRNSSEYSNDKWMMMGYLAYKARNSTNLNEIESGNLPNVINEVNTNFKQGKISVYKKSSNSYTLSNEYGSVNVHVKRDTVVVSGDGTSNFPKTSLKEVLGGENSLLNILVKYISSNKVTNNTQSSSNTQKIAKENIKNFFDTMWIFNESDSLSQRATKMLNYGDRKAVTGIAGNDAFENKDNQADQKGTYYQPIEITKSKGMNENYDVVVYSKVDSPGGHSVKARITYTVSVDKEGKVSEASLVLSDVESEH